MSQAPTISAPRARGQRLLLAAVVAVMALFTLPVARAQTTMLRWKWNPGDTLRYRMNQEMKQTITGIDDKEVSWTVQYIVRQDVKSVSDRGVATIEQTYESGTVSAVEQPGERVKYDSQNPKDADKIGHRLIAPYAAFIGKTITFDVGPEGEVPRLEGASAIVDSALANMKSDPMMAMLLGQFRESLGDEAMRRQLELALRVVPARSCKTGDQWKVSLDQDMPLVGTLRNDVTYKLKRLSERKGAQLATIDASGKLSQVAGGGAEGEEGGMAAMLGGLIDIKLKSSNIEGDVSFDVENGRIQESGYSIESDWEIGIKGLGGDEEALPGEAAAAMKGTQRLEQRARLELIP
jgi:hypothetical protein